MNEWTDPLPELSFSSLAYLHDWRWSFARKSAVRWRSSLRPRWHHTANLCCLANTSTDSLFPASSVAAKREGERKRGRRRYHASMVLHDVTSHSSDSYHIHIHLCRYRRRHQSTSLLPSTICMMSSKIWPCTEGTLGTCRWDTHMHLVIPVVINVR